MVDQKAVFGFIRRNGLSVATIALVVVILAAYHVSKLSGEAGGSGSRTSGVAYDDFSDGNSAEIASREHLYDASQPGVDPKYGERASLSANALHQLILDLSCLQDLASAHEYLYSDYNDLYRMIAQSNVRDAIFWRIEHQKGFMHEDLPKVYRLIVDGGELKPRFSSLRAAYVAARVDSVRNAIIGGNYRTGDVKFAKSFTHYYEEDIPKVAALVQNVRQMQQWLIDDNVITKDSAHKTSLDGVTDASQLIAEIRHRHAEVAPDSPPPVIRFGADNRGGTVLANLSAADNNLVVSGVIRLANALGSNVNIGGISSAKPTSDLDDRERHAEIYDYMTNSKAAEPSLWGPSKPELRQRLRDYVVRRALFRSIGDELTRIAKDEHVDHWSEIQAAYRVAINSDAVHDQPHASGVMNQLEANFGRRDLEASPFTVAEVEYIRSEQVWLAGAVAKYDVAGKQMDELLTLLRSCGNNKVVTLVRPYHMVYVAMEIGPRGSNFNFVLDAFLRPSRAYLADNAASFRPATQIPHVGLKDDKELR